MGRLQACASMSGLPLRAEGAPPPRALAEHSRGVLRRIARSHATSRETARFLPLVAAAAPE
eukprot:1399900-Pyramimonas_sp.AAC.1